MSMDGQKIENNVRQVAASLPMGVTLVAVSKFHPADALMRAYNAGQRDFGESRAQEMVDKAKTLPNDIRWHFIGHLQTNKVRMIMPYVSMIHSIDSPRLLKYVSDEAVRAGRVVDVLLQAHVADEETKTGFMPDELVEFAEAFKSDQYPGVRVRGLMGMATNTDNEVRIRNDFEALKQLFVKIKSTPVLSDDFKVLSMGMSHDYPLALECGSNMVRVGTMIFGEREY
ncbi:MAG: YggS family pyridoxal phosphate-dependent enzyme [Muribaculum sp.]|nr:YggS family pyridoxal phosphate-dependent enzyme [Muribaculaceae bacterium]MCM1080809.1 YggS family pyridoxal phosphate-dependent enzyme [Muribaculum sp.]